MSTLTKLDGFEHGVAALGTAGVYDNFSGSPTIVTSPVRSGARALKIAAAAAACRVGYNPPASTRQCTQSVAIYFQTSDGLPAANCVLALFVNANGNGQLRYHQSTGKLALAHNNAGNTDFGPVIALDTWYWIDLSYDSSTGTVSITGRVDFGTEVQVTRSQTAADCTSIGLGTVGSDTFTAYYDDWIQSVTIADYPLRAHHIEALIPSSDGTHNIATSGDFDSFTTTQFSNSTTNGNTFLGHRPLQVANTADQVIRQELGGTSDYMEFGLENLATGDGVPVAARVYAAHVESATSGASLAEARLLLSSNTEVLTEGSLSAIDTSEDPGTTLALRKRMTIDPSGGWDRTKVDGLKARVGFGDGVPDVNFIDFMVEVALYDALDATATPSTVTAVEASPSATPLANANAAPATVVPVLATPTPSIMRTATAIPSDIARAVGVWDPTVDVGSGDAVAAPGAIGISVRMPHPSVSVTGIVSTDTYAFGYGGGYQSPETVVVEEPEHGTTPELLLEIDWVTDVNTLDDPYPEHVWTNMSSYVRASAGFSLRRGKQRALDKVEAATFTATLTNRERHLDPSYDESPFYPNVSPMRWMRASATLPRESDPFTTGDSLTGGPDLVGGGEGDEVYTMFYGFIESFTYDYPGKGKDATVVIQAVDSFAAMVHASYTSQPSDPHHGAYDLITNILDFIPYTGRGERINTIDPITGVLTVSWGPADPDARSISTEYPLVFTTPDFEDVLALDTILQAAESEGGNFFIARDGKFTYLNRKWPGRPIDSELRFSVDDERFSDIQFGYDDTLVYNIVTFTATDGSGSATEQDAASIARYFESPFESEVLLAFGTDLTTRAHEFLLRFRRPVPYVQRLQLDNVTTNWRRILTLDLWDKVMLSVPQLVGDNIDQQSLIEGIEISSPNHKDWHFGAWLSVAPFPNIMTEADSTFESAYIDNWTAESNCTLVLRSNQPRLGSYGLGVVPVTTGDVKVLGPSALIEPRRTYLAEVFGVSVRTTGHSGVGGGFGVGSSGFDSHVEIVWLDSAANVLSTNVGTTKPVKNLFKNLFVEARAPTGAVSAQIRVVVEDLDSDFTFVVDDATIARSE